MICNTVANSAKVNIPACSNVYTRHRRHVLCTISTEMTLNKYRNDILSRYKDIIRYIKKV